MLSIVIPTRQRFDLLQLCLRSVTRHAPPDSEIVVVEDGPGRAACGDVVRAYANVRHLRLGRNGGFASAANAGIQASHGDIVELLNDDTEVQAGWAEAAQSWFVEADVAAVAPLVLDYQGRIDSAGDRYYVGGIAAKRGQGAEPTAEYLRACPVFGASASSAFYRRAALHEVGLFPESFGSYFEDVDLAFRLQRGGWRTMFEPAARVLHRGSASFGKTARKLIEQQSRNEERVFWRNVPGLARALPRHALVLAGKAHRRWQEGTLAPFVCGRLRVLGEMAEIWRHRRSLPSHKDSDCQIEERYWGSA